MPVEICEKDIHEIKNFLIYKTYLGPFFKEMDEEE